MKKSLPRQAGELVIYQTKEGGVKLRGDFSNDTLWATQAQITNIFDIDRTVVTKHINTILKSEEVEDKSNVEKCTLQIVISL